MEESEKRRDRLKAMRLEAVQATVSRNAEESPCASPGLSNPLVESVSSQLMQENSHAAPRFDYYTDPMSAFSANKRRSKVSHQVPQDLYTNPRPRSDMPPAPDYGANNTYSSMHRAGRFGSPHVNSPGVLDGSNNYSPYHRMFPTQGVYPNSPHGSPMQTSCPFGTPQVRSPGMFIGPISPSGFFPPNLARGGSSPSPHFAHGGQNSFVRGRGQGFNCSPGPPPGRGSSFQPNTGRGRSHWSGNRTSPGRGRGRWGSSHGSASGEFRPERYYNRSMIEDPWEQLKPVIWRRRNTNTQGSPASWLPKSIQTKRARVAEDSKKSTSEPSLAEYLAATIDEVVDPANADDS